MAAGPARYRVVSVTSNLKGYRDQFDQSGKKHRPGFAKDRLAVVVLEIQNVLQRPIEPPVFMAALTTSDGLRVTDWALDARQQPFLDESTRYGRSRTSIPAQIAAGQTAKVALVFSMGPDVKATKLEFAPANFRDMRFGDPARGQRRPPAGPGGPAGMPLRAYRVEIDLK